MKEQLTDIENEKSNISDKISELTKSLGQTNLVNHPFKENKVVKKIKYEKSSSKKEVDLSEEIKKIFSKQ